MNAKKCDRCGEFYSEYNTKSSEDKPNGFQFLNLDNCNKYYAHTGHDLCPECCKSLIEWFKKVSKEVEKNDD